MSYNKLFVPMKESRSITEASRNYNSRALSQVKSFGLKPPQMRFEALRLQVCNKLDSIIGIFKKNEKQLGNFFTKYIPMPQSQINLRRYSNDRYEELRLVKTVNKIYYGNFRDKQRYGEGVLIDESGKIYEGNFCQNVKSGHGVEIYANKNIYLGEFSGNKKHGHGKFFWFNLSYPIIPKSRYIQCYEGTWWGGLPDGRGTHQKASGDLYKGQFKNGLKHGEGEEDFQNGDVYKGQYVNGLPEGNGIYIWADGSRYEGQFKQGLRNGRGIWKSIKENQQYQGEYVLDKKCGYGQFTWHKRDYLYRGYFQNDLRHGYGELFLRGELQYKGNWINGKTEQDMAASFCSKRSQSSKKSFSVKSRSMVRTPKGKNFPVLSKTRRPVSSLKNFIPLEVLKEKKIITRNRSPKNNTGSASKLSKPKKKMQSLCSSKEKIRPRPISYNKKQFRSQVSQQKLMPTREFLNHVCKKKNCGCHDDFKNEKKVVLKSRKRPITHLATQPMCF